MLEKILSKVIGTYVSIDIEKDAIEIKQMREHTEKETSLLSSKPQIIQE